MGGVSDRWTPGFVAKAAVTELSTLGEHAAARFRRFSIEKSKFKTSDEVERVVHDLRAFDKQEDLWTRLAMLGRHVGLVRQLHALLDEADAQEPEEMKQWEAALEKERVMQVASYNIILSRCGESSEQESPEVSAVESGSISDDQQREALVLLMLALWTENVDLLTRDEVEITKRAFATLSEQAGSIVISLPNWLASAFTPSHLVNDPTSAAEGFTSSEEHVRLLALLLKVGDSAQKVAALKLLKQLKISEKTIAIIPPLVKLLECEIKWCQGEVIELILYLAQDHILRAALVDFGVIPILWGVFCSSDDNDKSRAEVALQCLSEDDHAAVVLNAAEAVPSLIGHIQNEDVEASEIASSLLLELVEDSEYKDLMVNSTTLEPVTKLLENNQGGQSRAVKLLAKLSRSEAARARIAAEETITRLAALVEQGDHDGRCSAAVTLWNLYESEDLQPRVIGSGMLPTILLVLCDLAKAKALDDLCDVTSMLQKLVQLLKFGEDASKSIALGVLCGLVEDNLSNWNAFNEVCPIPLLLTFIRDHQHNRSAATKLIDLLATDQGNRARTVSEGGIGALVNLACDGNPAESAAASAALNSVAYGDKRATVLSSDDMSEILRLVQHEDPVKSADGLSVLIKLFSDTGNRDTMVSIGIIPLLITTIRDHPGPQRTQGLVLLEYLAHDNELEKVMGSTGAIPPVVAVLRDGSPEEKAAAASTLQSLSVQLENKVLIAASGGIEALVELVREGNAKQKENALATLTNLSCRSEENKKRITATGIIPLLVELLGSNSKPQQIGAVKLLRCLANLEDNRVLIVAAGAVPLLIKTARDGEDQHRTRALITLKLLALNSDNEVLIASSGGLEIALALVFDGNNAEKAAAAGLLACLSVNPEHKSWLAAVGAVDGLVQLVQNGNNAQRQNAMDALFNLADISDNRQLIASLDGISAVASLFSSEDADCRRKSMSLVAKLAVNSELKMLVNATGVIGTLIAVVSTLDVDESTRQGALDVLHTLVDDVDCRHTMVREGVIPTLVSLTTEDAPSDLKTKAAVILDSFLQDESLCGVIAASGWMGNDKSPSE